MVEVRAAAEEAEAGVAEAAAKAAVVCSGRANASVDQAEVVVVAVAAAVAAVGVVAVEAAEASNHRVTFSEVCL